MQLETIFQPLSDPYIANLRNFAPMEPSIICQTPLTTTALIASVATIQTNESLYFAIPLISDEEKNTQQLKKYKRWNNKEYRHAISKSTLESLIAWQIKINRESRGLTQKELAKAIQTKQSAISRLEDSTYGKQRIDTLLKIAKEFDCALQLKLIPFSQLAAESRDVSPATLYVKSFHEEVENDRKEGRNTHDDRGIKHILPKD